MESFLSRNFPNLTSENHRTTSPATGGYNCIAWAAGKQDRNWWPSPTKDGYWPPGFRKGKSLRVFSAVFLRQGYVPCDDGALVDGIEKVCLYTDANGDVTHMARQLPDGKWTSKLGTSVDIEHSAPEVLDGGAYGKVASYLKRTRRS